MPVFFISSKTIQGRSITLEDPLYTHISKSLRVRVGQVIRVCDEHRLRYAIRITKITKKFLIGEIQETLSAPPKENTSITLAQSILKGPNMVWAIQKATELGVNTITPIITERVQSRAESSSMKHFQERWQKIALEAAQQSERWDVPTILDPQFFRTFLQSHVSSEVKLILTERERNSSDHSVLFGQEPQTTHHIVIAVGPEGGWNQKELEEAEITGFTKITLGEKVLRSETAAITGLVMLQERLNQLTFQAIFPDDSNQLA